MLDLYQRSLWTVGAGFSVKMPISQVCAGVSDSVQVLSGVRCLVFWSDAVWTHHLLRPFQESHDGQWVRLTLSPCVRKQQNNDKTIWEETVLFFYESSTELLPCACGTLAMTQVGSACAVFHGHDGQDAGSDDGHASGEAVERREAAAPPWRLSWVCKKPLL